MNHAIPLNQPGRWTLSALIHPIPFHTVAATLLMVVIPTCLAATDQKDTAPPNAATVQDLPRFEVASIKPILDTSYVIVSMRIYPGGRLEMRGTSLEGLIHQAFLPVEISGGGDLVYQARFDLVALPPKDIAVGITDLHTKPWIGDQHLRQMLQALLVDRFALRFHYEQTIREVYVLQKGKGPVTLRPTAADDAYLSSPAREPFSGLPWKLKLRGASLAELASRLSGTLGTPVLDHTGLTGRYDFEQRSIEPDPEQRMDFVAAYLSMLKEMNLELAKSKQPIQRFVVDSVQHPSPN